MAKNCKLQVVNRVHLQPEKILIRRWFAEILPDKLGFLIQPVFVKASFNGASCGDSLVTILDIKLRSPRSLGGVGSSNDACF